MSHASIIVALSPEDVASAGSIEEAVGVQMAPFCEEGEWFKEGSRWDYWLIGGRFAGKLGGVNPREDKDNYRQCPYCNGSGSRQGSERIPKEPTAAGHPVIGTGCNACYGTGWELKWPTEWKGGGNIAKRSEVKEGLTAFAFLRNKEWHEQGRLGWFGSVAKTECEIKAEEGGKEFTGRCLHTCSRTGAKIVSWTGAGDTDERWAQLYFARFIRNLPDDTTLVVVDYHV